MDIDEFGFLPVLVMMLQQSLMYFSKVNLGRWRSGTICTGSMVFQRYWRSSVVQPSGREKNTVFHTAEHIISWLHLKRISGQIAATLRATWALLFGPTWSAAVDWTLLLDERSHRTYQTFLPLPFRLHQNIVHSDRINNLFHFFTLISCDIYFENIPFRFFFLAMLSYCMCLIND